MAHFFTITMNCKMQKFPVRAFSSCKSNIYEHITDILFGTQLYGDCDCNLQTYCLKEK